MLQGGTLLSRSLPLAALLFFVLAGVARGGTYDVYSCWAGADSFRNPGANAGAWTKSVNDHHFLPFDQCGASENGFGVISQGGDFSPPGAQGEVAFPAPDGTRIERVRLWRTAWSYGSGSGPGAQRHYLNTLGDGALHPRGDAFDGSADVPHGAAGTTDTANHGLIPANLLDVDMSNATPALASYRVGCAASGGC